MSTPHIAKRSEHGLGRYLDPLSPQQDRRDDKGNRIWISEAWEWILLSHEKPEVPPPDWAARPALSRITVSSPLLLRPFAAFNRNKAWQDQIKPFNFLLVATIDPFGYPPDVDATRFRLTAPYNDNPDEWPTLPWRNLYDPDGPNYRLTTNFGEPPHAHLAVAKSCGQVLREYRAHPEHKFNGSNSEPCAAGTQGVLTRRSVHHAHLVYIGKEANRLDEVQAGLIGHLGDVTTGYGDTDSTEFREFVMPVLDRYSGRELAKLVDVDRRTIDRIRDGQIPRPRLRKALGGLAVTLAAEEVADVLGRDRSRVYGMRRRGDEVEILAAWRVSKRHERAT